MRGSTHEPTFRRDGNDVPVVVKLLSPVIGIALGAALFGAGVSTGCATAADTLPPPDGPAPCASARLAREWDGLDVARLAGCYVDDAGAIASTVVLFDVAADTAVQNPDEPARFALGTTAGVVPFAWWEWLGRDLVRLSFPDQTAIQPGRHPAERLQATDACLVTDRAASTSPPTPTARLRGGVYAVLDQPPFAGPASRVSLRRIPCPAR